VLYRGDADVYSQAASNLVSGGGLEQTIQQILDMGGGTWERDMVVRALRAAYNNPERAIDYLYSVSSMLLNFVLPFMCSIIYVQNPDSPKKIYV
jgi:hypothetical protein